MPSIRQPRFVVVIPLAHTALELATTASHALSILNGETVFSGKLAKVFGEDGQPVTKRELARIVKQEPEHGG